MSTEVNIVSHEEGLQLGKLLGGWTPYTTDFSMEARDVFDRITMGHRGVSYTLIAVAEQDMLGRNYSFFCNVEVIGSGLIESVTIRVFSNHHGALSNIEINPVNR